MYTMYWDLDHEMCLSNSLSRLERISTFEKQVSKQWTSSSNVLHFNTFWASSSFSSTAAVDCHFQSFFLTKSGSFGSQRKICQLELYVQCIKYYVVSTSFCSCRVCQEKRYPVVVSPGLWMWFNSIYLLSGHLIEGR